MREPSVKGAVVQLVAKAIEQLVAEGKLDQAALEAELAAEDRALLDGELVPGLWYPIASFERLLMFALEKEGSPPENWPQLGFEAAEQLLSGHAYEGMVRAASKRGDRSGFALVHLVPLFLNFSEWRFEQDPGDGSVYHVEATDAEPLPDAFVALLQGIIEYLSQRVRGIRLSVSGERVARDRIVFRATRATREESPSAA